MPFRLTFPQTARAVCGKETDLLDDLVHRSGSNRAAAFADSEALLGFHGDRSDQLDGDGSVESGHNHVSAFGQRDDAGHVGGPEVELGPIVGHEGRMTAAFFLGEDVDGGGELGMRGDGTGLREDLSALDFFLLGTAEEAADVVAGLTLIEALAEHFNAGDDGLGGFLEADDLDVVVDFHNTALDTAGNDGAAAFDGEDVFDRHQEGLVGITDGLGDPGVDGIHEFLDAFALGSVGIGGLEGGIGSTLDDGGVVAVEAVLVEELTDFHFDEFEELGIGDIDLVQEHDDAGNADLLGQEDVLFGLGHHAVSGADEEDGAVHLSRAGDHVLDIVRMAGAVNVSVVTLVALVFHVAGGDGEDLGGVAAALGFRGLGDLIVGHVAGESLQALHMGDGSGEGGFPVVNVTDGSDVYVRLGSFERLFCHFVFSFG